MADVSASTGKRCSNGLLHACEKRPVAISQLEPHCERRRILRHRLLGARTQNPAKIGELIMNRLRKLDKVCLRSLSPRSTLDFQGCEGIYVGAQGSGTYEGPDSCAGQKAGRTKRTLNLMTYKGTLIPGDGIGPRRSWGAAIRILEATGLKF